MIIIGIGLIIIVTILAVHFVFKRSYKLGYEAGESDGRQQILEENIIRANMMQTEFDEDLRRTSDMLSESPPNKSKYEHQMEG
jgi:hypothetical protein